MNHGNIIPVKLIEVKQFANFHFNQFQQFGIINHIHLVQEDHDLGNIHLAGQEDVLPGLRHRTICSGNNNDSTIHLGSTSYHVLNVVSVTGTVNVCIVAVFCLIFDMRCIDCNTTLSFQLHIIQKLLLHLSGRDSSCCL